MVTTNILTPFLFVLSMVCAIHGVTITPACSMHYRATYVNHGDQVIIQSPNYPNNYRRWQRCNWFPRCIYGRRTAHFDVTCDNNFNIPARIRQFWGRKFCLGGSYLYILYFNNRYRVQRSYECGTTKPADFSTSTGAINLHFRGYYRFQGAGFKCTLTCVDDTVTTPPPTTPPPTTTPSTTPPPTTTPSTTPPPTTTPSTTPPPTTTPSTTPPP